MTPYLEKDLESHIEQELCSTGYATIYTEKYDKELCLIPEECYAFLKTTQPKAIEKLTTQYGSELEKKICYRIAQEIKNRGSLDVIRKGITDRGVSLRLAFFKPKNKSNPQHALLYSQNRLVLVRQLKYSQKNENSIDIVLFLNGIPIISMELKNLLTGQCVWDAIRQYKKDRQPQGEPFLEFERLLVHFAVDNDQVYMTTRLCGDSTYFLPFNKDIENPINPDGVKTAYLWKDILKPDSLLELLESYLHIQETKKKYYDKKTNSLKEKITKTLIFPRFHQLDAVRSLLQSVRQDGAGKGYLIQHSAGSGKSNSIAWLSHQLAGFFQSEADTQRLFDSIIVVTDRRVLDRQLRNTIKQFEQTSGVVEPIEKHSGQLRDALQKGKSIIVTTIQKFPVISEEMSDLKGSRFAVIIDEAHTSQSGESSKHLKKVLRSNITETNEERRNIENTCHDELLMAAEPEEAYDKTSQKSGLLNDNNQLDLEDVVLQEITNRGIQKHISYFAFTATPKSKTLEIFGHKKADGQFEAFHAYSMRQAITEHFILDVLKNYTTYKRYFSLIQKTRDERFYSRRKAAKHLTKFADSQKQAIEAKANIMLDHFLDTTVHAIQGKARAMIVASSRLHAVRYFRIMKRLMRENKLEFKPLVAFSGTVRDPDTSQDHTENSLNELSPKVRIEDAFKTPEYRILIVANKFQTGFDEPFLHTMYVDKPLLNVNAVQTLSRLNRTTKGKTDVFILDFVNQWQDIQLSFQPYYQSTLLEEATDPNILYDIKKQLEQSEIYSMQDINSFCLVFYDPRIQGEKMFPILDTVVSRVKQKNPDEQKNILTNVRSYINLYSYISQIFTFQDPELEKLFIFLKNLEKKLPRQKTESVRGLEEEVALADFRYQKTYEGQIKLAQEDGAIKSEEKTGQAQEDEKDSLANIIKALNEIYAADFNEEEQKDLEQIHVELQNNQELKSVLENKENTLDNKKYKFTDVFNSMILELLQKNLELYNKLTNPNISEFIKKRLFDGIVR